MTDDEVANLIEAGWTPPPHLWLPPSSACEEEVCLVWLVECEEPFAHGFAEFAHFNGVDWRDANEHKVETNKCKVGAIAPSPNAGVEFPVFAERLLRKYRALERAGKLPKPSRTKKIVCSK